MACPSRKVRTSSKHPSTSPANHKQDSDDDDLGGPQTNRVPGGCNNSHRRRASLDSHVPSVALSTKKLGSPHGSAGAGDESWARERFERVREEVHRERGHKKVAGASGLRGVPRFRRQLPVHRRESGRLDHRSEKGLLCLRKGGIENRVIRTGAVDVVNSVLLR